MVGVTLFELLERRGSAPSLFGEDIRRDRLNEVVDRLNSRFGGHTIYVGGAQSALDSAPMRIAFSHIPDLKLED
jgi:DNA polymerase-4